MKLVKYTLPVAALTALCLLTLFPATAHADSFDITWSGPFGSGSIIVGTTSEGGGEFLFTSLTGTQAGLPLTLAAPGTYANNNNLIFPAGGPSSPCASSIFGSVSTSSDLDNCGFSFNNGTNFFNIYAPYTDVVPGTTY